MHIKKCRGFSSLTSLENFQENIEWKHFLTYICGLNEHAPERERFNLIFFYWSGYWVYLDIQLRIVCTEKYARKRMRDIRNKIISVYQQKTFWKIVYSKMKKARFCHLQKPMLTSRSSKYWFFNETKIPIAFWKERYL